MLQAQSPLRPRRGVGGNIARYINHKCEPNCYTQVIGDTIWIRAAKNIRKGEELIYDYSTDGEGSIQCRCRPGCKTISVLSGIVYLHGFALLGALGKAAYLGERPARARRRASDAPDSEPAATSRTLPIHADARADTRLLDSSSAATEPVHADRFESGRVRGGQCRA